MARERVKVDKTNFEKLCNMQCTEVEIADFFHCSHDAINKFCLREYKKTFEQVFAEMRSGGKISLRRSQWQLAEKNATMAIWLGKQYLGQKDEQTINQNVAPIVFKDDLEE